MSAITRVQWGSVVGVGMLMLGIFLWPFSPVLATKIVPCDGGDACQACHLATLANNILKFLIMMSILIGTIMVMYAGFLLVTAQGNMSKLSKAKEIFTDVIVGIMLILLSYLIVDTVMKMLVDPSFIQGGKWYDLSSSCVPNPGPTKMAEKPVNPVSVIPGSAMELNQGANDGSAGTGTNGNNTPGTPPADAISADEARARLAAAGIKSSDIQTGVDLQNVSQARIDQVAQLARDCSLANGGTETSNTCGVSISSGFRAGTGQSNHGTGDAIDISGRSQMFNSYMQGLPNQTTTFGTARGPNTGNGTCVYHQNENGSGMHWHCSSTGF